MLLLVFGANILTKTNSAKNIQYLSDCCLMPN